MEEKGIFRYTILFNIFLVPYQAGMGRRASSACLYHHAAHQSQWQIQPCKMGGTKLSSLESEGEPRRCPNPTTAKSGIGCFSLLHHGSQDTEQVVPKIKGVFLKCHWSLSLAPTQKHGKWPQSTSAAGQGHYRYHVFPRSSVCFPSHSYNLGEFLTEDI